MLLKFARAIIANTIYLLFELLVLSSTFRLIDLPTDGGRWPVHSTSYSSSLGIADRARCLRLPVFFGSGLVGRGSANECITLSVRRGPEPQRRFLEWAR